MAFVKIETSVARNRKFIKAGPAPSWLWLCGVLYCQEGLTDGFIPIEALPHLGVKNAGQLATHLVKAGLWDEAEGGWQVHDYLTHNKPAAEVRRVQGERRAAGELGGRISGEERRKRQLPVVEERRETKQVASTPAKQTTKQTANPETEAETEAETEPFAPPAGGSLRPMSPILDRSHMKHAECGRICLHASQFGEFVRRRNHDGADAEVRAWAEGIIREWTSGQHAKHEPGDIFDFWRSRYSERWPASKAAEAKSTRAPEPVYTKVKALG